MNRKRKIKQMRKFILRHGELRNEGKIPPNKYYRKGYYFAAFVSDQESLCISDRDKYQVYKGIIEEIREYNLTK